MKRLLKLLLHTMLLVLIGICSIIYLLDGLIHSILGPLAPQMAASLHLSSAELGPIFSSNLVGQCIGLVVLPLFVRDPLEPLRTRRLGMHFVRGATGALGNACFFWTLTHLLLADAMAQQRLRPHRIADPHEAVVTLVKAQSRLGHLAGEPLPAVQADIDGEGKPRLHPHVQQTELGMQEVMVQVRAPAWLQHQIEHLRLAIAPHRVRGARLDRTEHRDQPLLEPVLAGDRPGQILLGLSRAAQMAHRPARGRRAALKSPEGAGTTNRNPKPADGRGDRA
mgnify:CR=1 FL=1